MHKKINLTTLILLFLLCMLSAQNQRAFFKVFPVSDANVPDWAALMYGEDPNVFEVQKTFDKHIQIFGFEKTIHTQNYKHWIRQVQDWVNNEGLIRIPSLAEKEALRKKIIAKRNKVAKNTANWTAIGPFETYKQGTTIPYSLQTNVYSIDIFQDNPNILICGTETGMVFHSNDKGLFWQSISDFTMFSGGITAVKIHPEDPQHFFVGADKHIYETIDGGGDWREVFFLDGSANEFCFDPSNAQHMFCSASSGLFESVDGGMNWIKKLSNYSYDVVFHPENPSILYTLVENPSIKSIQFRKSVDNGANWSLINQGWYSPSDPSNAKVYGGKIGVSPADPSRVYACLIGDSKSNDNGWIGVYRSDNEGTTWYNPVGQDGAPYNSPNAMPWNVAAYSDGYHQGYYNFDLEVSSDNANLFWIGTIRLSESSDGGLSFQSIGAANSQRLDNQHADIQDIEVIGNEIWVASDGGINYSTDNMHSSESRKNGINGSDFWGFGSGWNEDILVGGKYHNGNSAFYQTYSPGIFHHVGGVEEATGYVHPIDSRKAFFNTYWAGGTETVIIPDQLGAPASYQGIIPYLPNESYSQSWSSGFFFDPRYADHMYMGEGSKIWKSENGGSYFEALHDFGTDRRVLEIKISRANPEMLYAVVGGNGYWNASEIFRSEDGGANWTKLSDLTTDMWRVEISLNPENENEIWASANSGADGNKVFQSLNKGVSWTNKTTDELDGESIKDIFYQGGSEGVVYLASKYSMYRYDPNSEEWINCSEGLPFVVKAFEMRPFYRDQKLRIATYGKGIWETPLESYSKPIAQPITHADKVYCARDTVLFDCYSILDHKEANWQWTFTPTPLYVSDLNARNPKVVFGGDGTFDVNLKIQDQFGNESEQLIPSMVEVINYCQIDTVPGLALQCYENGDYAQTAAFGQEVSEFSLTAWVKPNGIQEDYTGIFMNDGVAGGFNFKNGNNTLAYHWPGGEWWWNSGLIVPADKWSHVAMVVNPSYVTLYLNGIPSIHNIVLEPLDLTTCKIGSYHGWDGRNYNGKIDEVAVWDRALTQEEVRKYRHLTKEDYEDDPHFIAYYQFNAPSPKVLNRVSGLHANLSSGAEKTSSFAPLGSGTASSQIVDSYGGYDYSSEGVSLKFDNGLRPNGEVYVSRIHLDPNIVPNENAGPMTYWIINNYGENEYFHSMSEFIIDPPFTNPTTEEIDNPTLVQLFHRGVNDDEDNWFNLCDAFYADNERYYFDSECEIGFEGQFMFTSNQPDTTTAENSVFSGFLELPKVFPNPALKGSSITFQNQQAMDFTIILFSQGGSIVKEFRLPANSTQRWEPKGLSAGMYFCKIVNEKYLKTDVLVIE
ncbi:MAG: T9SS type A sorting domain-containing protein [Bacteroidetes bacterium]|nr:T9SS type A sorting domain-containing protein [Bacteroidota bacterium]